MHIYFKHKLRIFVLMLSTIVITASCKSTIKSPIETSSFNQYEQIDTIDREEPDTRGIITYDTYQVLIADGNETIAQIGQRLGINGDKLALYNGLIPNYRPREKEMIALPEDKFISSSGWSTEIASATIDKAPSQDQKISLANNPLRHRVQEGETIYSLAREYKVSVSSIATWNGLGPDLDIKTGREIIIPAASINLRQSNAVKTPKIKELAKDKYVEKSNQEKLPKPANKKSSTSEQLVTENEPGVLNLKNNLLPEAKIVSIKPFIIPVTGTIVSRYSQDRGSQNNNGIDYETAVGSPVKVVADGTAVLISDIVGGDGKIVLIRHHNELITIYGRLTKVIIKKDQKLLQGQKIGEVIEDSQTQKGLMHFEVRKGMKSIDPETMIR